VAKPYRQGHQHHGKQGFEHKKASISGVAVRGWMVYQRQADEIKIAKANQDNWTT
jgi:hypothetical protein